MQTSKTDKFLITTKITSPGYVSSVADIMSQYCGVFKSMVFDIEIGSMSEDQFERIIKFLAWFIQNNLHSLVNIFCNDEKLSVLFNRLHVLYEDTNSPQRMLFISNYRVNSCTYDKIFIVKDDYVTMKTNKGLKNHESIYIDRFVDKQPV